MIGWKDFSIGALTFLVTHVIEAWRWSWFDPGGTSVPWFLNSGRAVAFTSASLLLVAAAVGAAAGGRQQDAGMRGCQIAAGAVAAMAVVLFASGPGTLFPIALLLGAGIAVASGLGGVLIGWALAPARRMSRR